MPACCVVSRIVSLLYQVLFLGDTPWVNDYVIPISDGFCGSFVALMSAISWVFFAYEWPCLPFNALEVATAMDERPLTPLLYSNSRR